MLSKILRGDRVEVIFTIAAYEGETDAYLVGDFNDWEIGANPMHRNADGKWETAVCMEPDRKYCFRYLINEQKWHNDPDADDYIQGKDGISKSVVSTAVTLADRHTTKKRFETAQKPQTRYRRVLMPFTDSLHFHKSFQPMLEMMRRLGGREGHEEIPELILLRVRDDSIGCQDKEHIYSELRGVQARLQTCPIPSRIDTVTGPTASSIVDYAGRHAVDLILMPKNREHTSAQKTEQDVAQTVAHTARCDTLIVD